MADLVGSHGEPGAGQQLLRARRVRRVVGTATKDGCTRIHSLDSKPVRGLHAPMVQGRKRRQLPERACMGTGMYPTCSSCDADRSKTRCPGIGHPCRHPRLDAPGNPHPECSPRPPSVRVMHAMTAPHEQTRPRRACSTGAMPLRNTGEHDSAHTQTNRARLSGATT